MRALVVEDDASCAKSLEAIINRTHEFEVRTAATVRAAVESLSDGKVDVVLLDLTLPDSSGLETFRRIEKAAPRVPIIVLTGVDDESLAIATMKEGAQDYMVKADFEPRILMRAIRYAVERARILNALDEQREFARAVLDTIPDRMYVKDKESRFLQINRMLASVLELSEPAEALGKTDFDYFQKEHAQEAFDEEAEIVRTGQPLVSKLEKEVQLNGRSTWLLTTKMPVRNAAGEVVGSFGISKDISEIKRNEEALRDSEARFRSLLASVMDYHYTVNIVNGISVTTLYGDGCVTVTGYTRQEYEADPGLWLRMVHAEDASRVIENLDAIFAGGSPDALEHRIIHKDGSIRWIRNTLTPHFDEQGRLTSYDGIVADITERKEVELQLRSANARLRELVAELTDSHRELQNAQLGLMEAVKMRSVGELAAGIAHEVRNPLAMMLLGLDCLAETCGKDPDLKGIHQDMVKALERANTIIEGLMDFSSSKKLELSECNLNEIVERSLEYVRHLLVQGKVRVTRNLDQGLPSVLADSGKLAQVFINLFTNACHAMPRGGTLSVRTAVRTLRPEEICRESSVRGLRFDSGEEVLAVEIEDSGTGIPEDILARVFDPFVTTKPVGQGTGLGLAVTRNIIELHGGRIDIRNREEGGVSVALTLRRGAAQDEST